MVSVDNLKVEFGVTPLFEDVSYVINKRDRIALVGKNGAGKSTTMNIICNVLTQTEYRRLLQVVFLFRVM